MVRTICVPPVGVDESSPFHDASKEWMEAALNGPRRVAIPWMSLVAFLRIATNPRALHEPLAPADAWAIVDGWLDAPSVWVPAPGRGHREILSRFVRDLDLRANQIPDAGFARFTEIAWRNPALR